MADSPLDHAAPHAGAAPYHAGRFHNPGAPPPRKRGLGFLRWRLSERGAAWPRQRPQPLLPAAAVQGFGETRVFPLRA